MEEQTIIKLNKLWQESIKNQQFEDPNIDTIPFTQGLINYGNTCYVNSIMQAMFSIPSLVNNFIERIRNESILYEHESFTFMAPFMEIIKFNYAGLIKQQNKEIRLDEILKLFWTSYVSLLAHENVEFSYRDQYDASQFFLEILHYFDKYYEEIENIKAYPKSIDDKNSVKLSRLLFSTTFEQDLVCFDCQSITTKLYHECLNSINQVYLFSSLDEAIKQYFLPDILEDYKCSSCNKKCGHILSKKIFQSNEIFVLKLVPYKMDMVTKNMKKLKSKIRINEEIDLFNYMSDESSSAKSKSIYSLRSIVLHHGESIDNGHFSTLAKNIKDNVWRHFNDSHVEIVGSLDEFMKKNNGFPFMAFYQRNQIATTIEISLSRDVSMLSIHAYDNDEVDYKTKALDPIEINLSKIDENNNPLKPSKSVQIINQVKPSKLFEIFQKDIKTNSNGIFKQANISIKVDSNKNQAKPSNTVDNNMDVIRDEYNKTNTSRIVLSKKKGTLTQDEKRERDKIRKREQRSRPQFRLKENSQKQIYKQEKRNDPVYYELEKEKTKLRKKAKRKNEDYRSIERVSDKIRKFNKRNDLVTIIKNYEHGIKQGPNLICVACGGLFFERSVSEFDIENFKDKKPTKSKEIICVVIPSKSGKHYLCWTCRKYVNANKVPNIALSRKLEFPNVDHRITRLNDVEERLCSPRLPFIRIQKLAWDQQYGLKGNVVNVPVDQDTMLQELPRNFDSSNVIQLAIMRQIDYQKPHWFNTVRTDYVIEAVRYLQTKELFKSNNIKFSDEWAATYGKDKVIDFVVEKNDLNSIYNTTSKPIQNNEIESFESSDEDYFAANNEASKYNPTMILSNQFWDDEYENQLTDMQLIQPEKQQEVPENDKADSICSSDSDRVNEENILKRIAPGQHRLPKSILADKDCEELTFLKIYGGEFFKPVKTISYAARCKSEFRRYDRRCAKDPNKIFFSYKKLIAERLRASINISLSKTSKGLTASEALNVDRLNELQLSSEAQLFLRTVRSSPSFWSWKKMEINAMIKQLGCPTFFLTFNPAEVDWPELICVLSNTINQNQEELSEEQAAEMSRDDKIKLYQEDPVTTARYFENRIRELLKFAFSRNGPFKDYPVKDYFWRVDSQYRGSPHVHMMIWNENAPKYYSYDSKNTVIDEQNLIYLSEPEKEYLKNRDNCIKFIDKFITCQMPDDRLVQDKYVFEEIGLSEEQHDELEDLYKSVNIKFQIHKHKKNCEHFDNEGNRLCKYGYPWPILEKTIILEPLCKKENRDLFHFSYNNFLKIRKQLEIVSRDSRLTSVTLDQFLERCEISFDEYIMALRSSINKTSVFLKRNYRELMMNPYNKLIMCRHRANMDIQYITDPYGVAAYLSAYMLKSNAKMSTLLRQATREINSNNLTIRQKLSKLANSFQNCSEISAQECVYTLLQMPVAKSSRETIFINTYPTDERKLLLKDSKYLKQLAQDSTNIYRKGIIEYYLNRPDKFKEMCYAEFCGHFDFLTNETYKNKKSKTGPLPKRFAEDDDDLDEDLFVDDQLLLDQEDDEINDQNLIESDDDLENQSQNTDFSSIKPNEIFKLKDNIGYVMRRRVPKILRYKRYNRIKDQNNYYRVELMLYLPWSIEGEYDKVKDCYKMVVEKKDIIFKNKANFEASTALKFEEALEQLEDDLVDHDEDMFQKQVEILLEVEKDQLQRPEAVTEEMEEAFGFHGRIEDLKLVTTSKKPKPTPIKMPSRYDKNEYRNLISNLNRGQHRFLMNLLYRIKRNLSCHFLVTGPGGVGKSMLIQAIYQSVCQFFVPNAAEHDEKITVLLGAFTGKAAFNIRGGTIHSLFKIPLGSKFEDLKDQNIKNCRNLYKHLKLVVIDEISMVSWVMLEQIDKRLRQIFDRPNILFGGINVILLGDFNQLRPPHGNSIYKNGYSLNFESVQGYNYNFLVESNAIIADNRRLLDNFELFELTEIMRQRDDLLFANALNTIANEDIYGLTPEQIQMFDSRMVRNTNDIPKNTIVLFYTNQEVNDYNRSRVGIDYDDTDNELVICQAADYTKGKDANVPHALTLIKDFQRPIELDKTGAMPFQIFFKIGYKYMLTINEDAADGLVNGAIGELKKIIMHDEKDRSNKLPKVKRVWLDFNDKYIGKDRREKNSELVKRDTADKTWTFLKYDDIRLCSSNNEAFQFEIRRCQFNLVEAEAITIHKSQGSTYDRIGVKLPKRTKMEREKLYVALSRVKTLCGLYLFGSDNFSIIPEHVIRMSMQEKQRELDKIENEDHQKFMRIMRKHRSLTNVLPCLEFKANDAINKISMMYLNIDRFWYKKDLIEKDYGFMATDILFFVECHFNLKYDNQKISTLNNYECVNYSGFVTNLSLDKNSSHGIMCFVKKDKKRAIKFISNNACVDQKTYTKKDVIEMSLFKVKGIYICCIYKHNSLKKDTAINQLIEFIKKHIKINEDELILIGDFNIDFNDLKYQYLLYQLQTELNLTPTFINQNTFFSKRGKSQIDWCFTNFSNDSNIKLLNKSYQLYESWFSDHTPIYLEIESNL